MLEQLETLPADPILGLSAACRADPNPERVDLTVGIYMDEQGVCPVFEAVQQAQREIAAEELTKAYLPPAGDDAFNSTRNGRTRYRLYYCEGFGPDRDYAENVADCPGVELVPLPGSQHNIFNEVDAEELLTDLFPEPSTQLQGSEQ